MENNTKEKINKSKYILYVIFIIYILLLIKIVLFKYYSLSQIIKGDVSLSIRSANLIPFKTVADFMEMKDTNLLRAFSNIFGNIGIFMPLGYFLPALFKKFNKLTRVIAVSVALSMFFECTQYFYYLGALDIDDLILNSIGAIIGYFIYYLIQKFITDESKVKKVSILLSVVAFAVAFTIAREEFGNILGLTTHEVMTIGDENIPKSEPNINGTYLSMEENKLKVYKGIVYEDSQEKEFLEPATVEIGNETDIYFTNIEESKNESTITYEKLSKEELLKIEQYSTIKVWNDEKNPSLAKVIVLSKKIEGSGSFYVMESNSNKVINGTIENVSDKGMVINLVFTQKLENGTSMSTSGIGEHSNLLNIEFKNNTKFKVIKAKSNGDLIETKEGGKEELAVEDSVQLKGIKEGKNFIADYIEIYKIVE